MKWKDMTTEQKEAKKAQVRKWKAEHRNEMKDRQKNRDAEHRAKHRAYQGKYKAQDLNKNGIPKNIIRATSVHILKKVHAKIDGYQIHHCFGYEDPDKFIYIPRKLHSKIHSFLDSLGIPSAENHWNVIRDMVNSCEDYTYIRC